ncbi:hypothetical protein Cni_G19319 [Canna indica]|uniref:GATA transcription factor n=1 Tax=Canna indica TaxID=4628 RepID=A0AAQ3QIE7_9LILI|nr:hypothetical protein Cni_G19319 [Canna indica]
MEQQTEHFAVSILNSMLHQMLTISSSSSPSPFSPLRSSLLTYSSCSMALEDARMETLLTPEAEEEVVRAEFSVDDLLNFEFAEEEEREEEPLVEQNGTDESNSSSSSTTTTSSTSSSVSFEPPLGIGLPTHDAKEFEWVSLFMDDSLTEFPSGSGAGGLPPPPGDHSRSDAGKQPGNCASKGPTFASPTVCILSTEAMVPAKSKRSKRSRGTAAAAAAWSMSGPRLFSDYTSNSTTSSISSCSSPATSSYPIHHLPPPAAAGRSFLLCNDPPPAKKQKQKKRGRKPKQPTCAATAAPGERRCAHCGSQKTPQWRAGPLGAKTLCNACGVRYKSGRLLPEYRPACSPTFVSHIHSNCHRKVLEMRRKKEAEPPPVHSC